MKNATPMIQDRRLKMRITDELKDNEVGKEEKRQGGHIVEGIDWPGKEIYFYLVAASITLSIGYPSYIDSRN